MLARRRANHAKGSSHFRAKLTEAQVAEIRIAEGTHQEIAIRHQIDVSQVTRIRAGQWKHLPGDLPPRDPYPQRGTKNGRAKLTPEQVAAIKAH